MRGTHDRALLESLEPRRLLATIAWDGGGGDHLWLNPLNWEGDVLPGAADTAQIGVLAGDPTIVIAGSTAVGAVVSEADLSLQTGFFRFTGASTVNADFLIGGATLTADAALDVSGRFEVLGGSLAGTGSVTVAGDAAFSNALLDTGGEVLVHGAVDLQSSLQLRRELNLYGRSTWRDASILFSAGSLRIWPGAGVALTGASVLHGAEFGAVYNGGDLALDGSVVGVLFYSGPGSTVAVTGTTQLFGRGAVMAAVDVADGATLEIVPNNISWWNSGPLNFYEGASWSGGGTLAVSGNVVSRADMEISVVSVVGTGLIQAFSPGVLRVGRLIVTGGTAAGPASAILVTQELVLDGGALGGVDIAEGAVGRLFSTSSQSFGSIINHGLLTLGAGVTGVAFGLRVENHGVLDINPGVGSNVSFHGLTGTGEVSLASGGLFFNASMFLQAPEFAGVIHLAENTTLTFQGAHTLGAASVVDGAGSVVLGGNDQKTMIAAGTIRAAEITISGRIRLDSPDWEAGLLTIDPTAIIALSGDFDLHIPVSWEGGRIGGSGRIIATGWKPVDITASSGAILAVELVNRTTITLMAGTLTVSPSGRIRNDGVIRLNEGSLVAYGPVSGPGAVRKVGFGAANVTGPGLAMNSVTEVKYGTLQVKSGTHTGPVFIASNAILELSGTGATFTSSVTGPGGLRAAAGAHTLRGKLDVRWMEVVGGATLRLWGAEAKTAETLMVASATLSMGMRADLSVLGRADVYTGTLTFDAGEGSSGSIRSLPGLDLYGSSTLGVQLVGGFVPENNLEIDLILGPVSNVEFETLQTAGFPPGILGMVLYQPTAIRFRFIEV